MSLQYIINNCDGITIDRRKMVGIQYTRNQIPRISETPTKNPWRFKISMPNSMKYGNVRNVLESIDNLDRRLPEVITFGNNPKLAWLFRYQGQANISQLSNITVSNFVGNQLTLQNLPVMAASNFLFRANDLIQLSEYAYPFTIVNDVPRGSTGTVTVTTNRPNILTNAVIGQTLKYGANCEFTLFCTNMPTYKLIPGGTTYTDDILTGNAFISWDSEFELYEYVGLS